jgi:hypothetical protein
MPEASVSPSHPPAEALSISDQALLLHNEIFGFENGIPSVESYHAAQGFRSHVRFDPEYKHVDNRGLEVEGAYFSADGEMLDHNIAQDLVYTGSPVNWVQTKSNREVLGHARDVIRSDQDLGSNAPTLELAEALASRMAENTQSIDDLALQRMLDLDAVARKELARLKGGKQIIDSEAAYSEREAGNMVPNSAAVGTAKTQEASRLDTSRQSQERLLSLEDMISGRARVDYEKHGHQDMEYGERPTDSDDTTILANLLSDNAVRTPEDIALVLYPEKLVGSSRVYGAVQGKAYAMSDSGRRGRLGRLSDAERAEVMSFARQVAVARRNEANVPEEFKRHNALPSHQKIAHELFPDAKKLTPRHWEVVRLAQARLRAIRLEQVRPDRFVGLSNRMSLAGDRIAGVRGRAPSMWQSLKAKAAATREALKVENLKQRVSQKIGATVLAATTFIENKPWERVVPTVREFATNVNLNEVVLAATVRLQHMATESSGRLRNYLSQRLEAARAADSGERNFQVIRAVAMVGFVSALAVRAYLQYHHGTEMPSAGGNHSTLQAGGLGGLDIDSSNTGSNTSQPTATEALTAAKPASNAHSVVGVGTFDGSKRIMGYPQGSVGYRVLENAKSQGFNVSNKSQADHLIDATLKMDHMSWTQKVGDHQQITLLSTDQVKGILEKSKA